MKRSLLAFLVVPAACLLWSSTAQAEVVSDDFDPQHSFRPAEFPWESGFLPSGGPLRVNLTATAFQEVDITMFGDADYDFDASTFSLMGTLDSGDFQNSLGVDVTVIVSINFLGISTDFEVGVYSISEEANAVFTPYLLPGHPDRPVTAAEAIGPNDLVNTAFTIPGFNIPGTLDIDYTVNIPGIEFRSTRVDLNDADDSSAASLIGTYDQEFSDLPLVLPEDTPGETASVFGTLHGTFDSEIAIVFTVTIDVTVLGQELAIGPFDITLDFPLLEDEPVVFEPELMEFDIPIPEPAGSSSGAADDSSGGDPPDGSSTSATSATTGGDDDSDSTTGGIFETSSESGNIATGTGGIPADNPGSDSGCGCTTSESTPPSLLLGLLGLVFVRRRRTVTTRR